MDSLNKYTFNNNYLPLDRKVVDIDISEYVNIETITESHKKYLLRNLTIDYTENKTDKEYYIKEKDRLDNLIVTDHGKIIRQLETKRIVLDRKEITLSIPQDIFPNQTGEIHIENEVRKYLSQEVYNIVSTYEKKVTSYKKDLIIDDNDHFILHNFRFDTNIGNKFDLLPLDSYIVLDSKNHLMFNYDIIQEYITNMSITNDVRIRILYFLHIHSNRKEICYLSRELEDSFYTLY